MVPGSVVFNMKYHAILPLFPFLPPNNICRWAEQLGNFALAISLSYFVPKQEEQDNLDVFLYVHTEGNLAHLDWELPLSPVSSCFRWLTDTPKCVQRPVTALEVPLTMNSTAECSSRSLLDNPGWISPSDLRLLLYKIKGIYLGSQLMTLWPLTWLWG